MRRLLLLCQLLLSLACVNLVAAESCTSDGEVQFVCGTTNPEDLYQVPGTP